MAQDPPTATSTPDSEKARLARQAREAQALRENLRKRRVQAQSRQADRPAPQDEA